MKNDHEMYIATNYTLLWFFSLLNVVVLFGITGGEWQNLQKVLIHDGGYIGLIISYLFIQHGTNSFLLDDNRLVIIYPLRPFFRKYVFPIEAIRKFRFHNIHISVLGPSVIIYTDKKMHFSYNGNKNKINKMIEKLNELGVVTETTKG